MLGKSAGAPITALALIAALSCAHNVAQDSASGEDGKIKGAKAIVLDQGEGKAKGIVTYPGGDRVDWKSVELPADKRGDLSINLKWVAPRPGLQLAFDVFDQWNTPVAQSKKLGKKSRARMRDATLNDAHGTYFIRVYAVGRGDAGTYKLTVDFKEVNGPMTLDLTKVDVPDPPRLAALPEVEVPCDLDKFDKANPDCKDKCPDPPIKGWKGCANVCPTPPDANNPACWGTMDCPVGQPRKEIKKCKPKDWPPCNRAQPDMDNPNCTAPMPPVIGRIVSNSVQGGNVIITIGAGTALGVQPNWKGVVLKGESGTTPLDGGEVSIIRVGEKQTVGSVHLTVDQINANGRVRLSQP